MFWAWICIIIIGFILAKSMNDELHCYDEFLENIIKSVRTEN